MRRIAIIAAVIGASALVLRAGAVKLHERLAARCEAMFERMPDTFPPKKMLRGIEDIGARTSRIVELLEAGAAGAPEAAPREAVRDAA